MEDQWAKGRSGSGGSLRPMVRALGQGTKIKNKNCKSIQVHVLKYFSRGSIRAMVRALNGNKL